MINFMFSVQAAQRLKYTDQRNNAQKQRIIVRPLQSSADRLENLGLLPAD